MGLDPETLLTHEFEEIEHTYTERDTALYALGVGLGHDPLDGDQLRFLYEDGMAALPTMAVVLAYPGFWLEEPWTGVDWVKVLHGEQSIRIHKPLPTAATVRARTRVTEVVDKGAAKGALIYTERDVYDCASGDLLCTLGASAFARGDGGFAAAPGPGHPVHHVPARAPDLVRDSPTLPQAALIYRLSGDLNPLHAVPAVARAAGFAAPILHGLATLGVAGHAILAACCAYDPARLRSMGLRFSAPVYPGETIRTEMWRDDGVVSFRSRVVARDVVVLDNGRAEVADL
jgi:acyl dehydratase